MKKATILLLTAMLVFGFAGCNRSTGGGSGESEGAHLDISIALWEINSSFPSGADDPVRKLIEDKFNITIVPAGLSWADDVPQQLGLWAASGQLPDVFCGDLCRSAQYRQWVQDGVIRSIPESMLSKYPNVNNAIKNDPEVPAYMLEGENWFIPRSTFRDLDNWYMERGILNRKDWRIKLGFDIPRTKQDFIDLCAAYAAMDPKGDGTYTVGLSFDDAAFIMSQTFPTFGKSGPSWIRGDDGLYYIPAWEDDIYELMCFLRDINKAGGLDPDFLDYMPNTITDGLAIMASGKIGMLGIQVGPNRWELLATPFLAANPGVKFEDMVDYFEILDSPIDGGGKGPLFGNYHAGYWSESYINVNVSDIKLDRILQLYDWMMGDEAMYMVYLGRENIDWNRDAGGKLKIINELPWGYYPIMGGGFANLASWYGDFQWDNPNIPQSVRDYCWGFYQERKRNWTPMPMDSALAMETIPERDALSGTDYWASLVSFIFDRSGASNETLYARVRADLDAGGYTAAKNAMNARARELGIIR